MLNLLSYKLLLIVCGCRYVFEISVEAFITIEKQMLELFQAKFAFGVTASTVMERCSFVKIDFDADFI